MRFKTPVAIIATGAIALGASACGGSDKKGDSSDAKPLAQIDQLTGATTAVKLDKGFVDALASLKVTPGAVGIARISSTGSAVFPITGGNVKYYKPGTVSPYVQGEIDHEGSGLSLKAGGTKVSLENFVVDPGKSVLTGKVVVNGKTAVPSAPLFTLDGSTLKPLSVKKSNNTGVLEGTTVKLSAPAAALLNKTFKIKALKPGLVIGIAKITVDLPKA